MSDLLRPFGIDGPILGACTGMWLETSGPEISSIDPTTAAPLGVTGSASRDDYDQVTEAARERFSSWRMVPAPVRGAAVARLGALLREHKEPLAAVISRENGKIRSEALGEVQEMIDICDFAVGLSRQLYGLTIASERPRHRMMEQWHPLGPVGIITAFNFPMAVWAWNAAIAAVCGDTCVWKPSPHTPLCAVAVQSLCNRVMEEFDAEGLFNVVFGGSDIGQLIADDVRVPLVSFTGSCAVGKKVAAHVGARLGRSILELGGNNGIIVLPDADLDLAVRAIVFGAVGTAGQRCTTTRRVFAHTDIASELRERLVDAYRSVSIGDPMAEGTLMGPLIAEASQQAFEWALTKAVEQGGAVLTGGSRIDRAGFFVEPTIVAAPDHESFSIAWEETFAPLLYFFEVASLDEAIAAHNAVPQGLSSAIFTDSVRAAETFLSPLGSDCGIANVNIGTSGAEIGGAFGGEKETGGGRESGSDSWKAYMRRQTCTVNWGSELPLAQGVRFD